MPLSEEKAPEIKPYGDTGLLIEFGDQMDRKISERVLALNENIAEAKLVGILETVPTFRSLLVRYNPLETRFHRLKEDLSKLVETKNVTAMTGRHWQVPVCYDKAFAPDLEDVAERLNLSPNKVITLHSEVDYHVYMIGFIAGCPYLGDMPEALSLPRRDDPRTKVPKGSIAIALTMTIVYPLVSPGGWHLIGKTPIDIFDIDWDEPALFSPGDKLTFHAIDAGEFQRIETAAQNKDYKLEPVL